MRVLAVDFGERRIGLAISDPAGWMAQPLEKIDRRPGDADVMRIKEICEEYAVGEIVVGVPLSLKGEVGPQAEAALDYADKLKKIIGLPVRTWDERLSTVSAQRALLEANVSRKKRKHFVDKIAATFILQAYLDSKEMEGRDNWEQENTQQNKE